MPDFLPRRAADMVSWSRNFDQRLNAAPDHFGIPDIQLAQYSDLHVAFAQAYQNAMSPGTRCVTLTAAKNSSEKLLRRLARSLAGMIRARRSIRDADKILLGVPPPKRKYTRIATPDRAPVVSVYEPVGGRVMLQLIDPQIPWRSAKPRGVYGASILMCVNDEPYSSDKGWRLCPHATTTRSWVDLPTNLPPGTKIWFKAQWFIPSGKAGPWSAPAYTYVGYVGMRMRNLAA
jgi:hypothetical protein